MEEISRVVVGGYLLSIRLGESGVFVFSLVFYFEKLSLSMYVHGRND